MVHSISSYSSLIATQPRIEKDWKNYKDSNLLVCLRMITNFHHHSIVRAKKPITLLLSVNLNHIHPCKLWQTIKKYCTPETSYCPSIHNSTSSNTSLPWTVSSFFTDKVLKVQSSLVANANLCSLISIHHSSQLFWTISAWSLWFCNHQTSSVTLTPFQLHYLDSVCMPYCQSPFGNWKLSSAIVCYLASVTVSCNGSN